MPAAARAPICAAPSRVPASTTTSPSLDVASARSDVLRRSGHVGITTRSASILDELDRHDGIGLVRHGAAGRDPRRRPLEEERPAALRPRPPETPPAALQASPPRERRTRPWPSSETGEGRPSHAPARARPALARHRSRPSRRGGGFACSRMRSSAASSVSSSGTLVVLAKAARARLGGGAAPARSRSPSRSRFPACSSGRR